MLAMFGRIDAVNGAANGAGRHAGVPSIDRSGAGTDALMTANRAPASRGVGRERTPFEWALLVVSLAATLAVVAGLVLSGLAGSRGPADLQVTVATADEPASGGQPVDVTVSNDGGTSAENVIIEVTVGDVASRGEPRPGGQG